MKNPFRLIHGIRGLILGTAALALYLPAMNLQQDAGAVAAVPTQFKSPAGSSLASAQTSWQTVLASGYSR